MCVVVKAMKVHIIIQARMGSARMPGKILKNLSGLPMLYHIVERCRRSEKASDTIVATTLSSGDDGVVGLCRKMGVSYFRGSENDVLSRYYEAAKVFDSKVVVRVNADCPLVDPRLIDICIRKFNGSFPNIDYISNNMPTRTFPVGFDVEVFSFNSLQHAHNNAKKQYEREHVTPHIWQNKKGGFNIGKSLEADASYRRDYRLTVDYSEDFELISKIYNALYNDGDIVDAREAIRFLDENPQIASINAHCDQKVIK
jgi:spore coat polysaccharide biosynthesis protein SpsF